MKKFVIILFLLLLVGGGIYIYFNFKDKCKEIVLQEEFKTEYFIGENLDVTNGKIKCVTYSGDEKVVDVTTDMISNFSTKSIGEFKMTLEYEGKRIDVDYKVKDEKVLEIISISGLKSIYNYKENLELDNVKISYRTQTSVKEREVTQNMISNFNTVSIGNKTMHIYYQGITYDFDYEVKPIKKINSISGLLDEYYQGVYESLTGAIAECENYDGTISSIEITSDMISGFDYHTIGSKIMTITITGVSYDWDYQIIKNEVVSIISVDNLNTKYEKSGRLNLNGSTITYLLKNGGSKTISIQESMISGFDTSTAGTKTMTITFEGKTKDISYNVYDLHDVVGNGLYYSEVNHSKGRYLYVYVDGTPSGSGNFRAILSDTAPGRMIQNDDLYRLGTSLTGTRTIEEGYIRYGYTAGQYSNIRFEIRVINGEDNILFEYVSEVDNISFSFRNMSRV